MAIDIVVPSGISQKPVEYDSSKVDLETLANEMSLLTLGDFEPLDFKIDVGQFMREISAFQSDWVEYLLWPWCTPDIESDFD